MTSYKTFRNCVTQFTLIYYVIGMMSPLVCVDNYCHFKEIRRSITRDPPLMNEKFSRTLNKLWCDQILVVCNGMRWFIIYPLYSFDHDWSSSGGIHINRENSASRGRNILSINFCRVCVKLRLINNQLISRNYDFSSKESLSRTYIIEVVHCGEQM